MANKYSFILALCCLLAANHVFGQEAKPQPQTTPDSMCVYGVFPCYASKVEYRVVRDVPKVAKTVLHSRAKLWFATIHKDNLSETTLDDAAGGEFIARTYFTEYMSGPMGMKMPFVCKFMIQISSRDGRYKAVAKQIETEFTMSDGQVIKTPIEGPYTDQNKKRIAARTEMFKKLDTDIKGLLKSLEEGMTKTASGDF